jgi:hypothetical protein
MNEYNCTGNLKCGLCHQHGRIKYDILYFLLKQPLKPNILELVETTIKLRNGHLNLVPCLCNTKENFESILGNSVVHAC